MAPEPKPDHAPAAQRLELRDLFNIAQWQDKIPWKPFQDGIDIHRLHGDGVTGPSAALMRFRKGGRVPLHKHTGCEHIIVLAGSERDQHSSIDAGTLIINPPGTQHSVVSDAGCIVLAIYEKPVHFLQDPAR
ncbi:MAG TPA: cupin domain-containing protein [Opitutaceae bacterium]|nr:cupin domain-containing protein [Opitutaceae bacterium]